MFDSERKTGIVKWFSQPKGYGFIVPDGGNSNGRDVFFHVRDINGFPQVKELAQDAKVSYLFETGEKGPRARDVVRLV